MAPRGRGATPYPNCWWSTSTFYIDVSKILNGQQIPLRGNCSFELARIIPTEYTSLHVVSVEGSQQDTNIPYADIMSPEGLYSTPGAMFGRRDRSVRLPGRRYLSVAQHWRKTSATPTKWDVMMTLLDSMSETSWCTSTDVNSLYKAHSNLPNETLSDGRSIELT